MPRRPCDWSAGESPCADPVGATCARRQCPSIRGIRNLADDRVCRGLPRLSVRHGPRKRWRLAALLALQPRRARRAFVASGIAVAVAGVVLAMGPALRWAEPASLSSVRTCSGSVCVWRDHARTLDDVREVVDTLEAERPDWLATPPRWQETRIASQDAAGFYLGNPNVDDVEIADAIAQGYLAWLTCDADSDSRAAPCPGEYRCALGGQCLDRRCRRGHRRIRDRFPRARPGAHLCP